MKCDSFCQNEVQTLNKASVSGAQILIGECRAGVHPKIALETEPFLPILRHENDFNKKSKLFVGYEISFQKLENIASKSLREIFL